MLLPDRIKPFTLACQEKIFSELEESFGPLPGRCQLHEVHPQEWLMEILTRVEITPDEELHTLLPHHWKVTRQEEKQGPLAKAA